MTKKSKDILAECRYCGNCDYAMAVEEYYSCADDYGCPRCGTSFLKFYSRGSDTHKDRWWRWVSGWIRGNPPPPPEDGK